MGLRKMGSEDDKEMIQLRSITNGGSPYYRCGTLLLYSRMLAAE
jgi:hypothetical protein